MNKRIRKKKQKQLKNRFEKLIKIIEINYPFEKLLKEVAYKFYEREIYGDIFPYKTIKNEFKKEQ
jgi:hypothetical protein